MTDGVGKMMALCPDCVQERELHTFQIVVRIIKEEKTWIGRCPKCRYEPKTEAELKACVMDPRPRTWMDMLNDEQGGSNGMADNGTDEIAL